MLAGLGLENDLRCVQRCAGTQLAGRSEAAAPHRVEARVNARRPCGTHAARSTALKRHKGLAKRRQALFERHISCAAAAASADFGGDAGQQQSVDANDVENRGNATFPQVQSAHTAFRSGLHMRLPRHTMHATRTQKLVVLPAHSHAKLSLYQCRRCSMC